MADDWISAVDAHRIIVALTDPVLAGFTICARANDGLVATRAARLIVGSDIKDNVEIPAEFWWARGQRELKQNWATGDFETWVDERVRHRAYGVEFRRKDIDQMTPRRGREQSVKRFEPGNYAPAGECLRELRSTLNCDEREAERLILRSCRAGLVPSRCSKISWRVTDRFGVTDEEMAHGAIPEWFWEYCLDDDERVLNWRTGRFAGRGVIDGEEYKAVISGVAFEIGAIVEIESVALPERSIESSPVGVPDIVAPKDSGSGRRLSERWRPWIAEFVAYIHERGIPEGVGSQGQEELIEAVASALAERGQEALARSTVQPVVQATLDRLRSARN